MRLLWSFVFALAKANLTIKLGTDVDVKNIKLDVTGAFKANDAVLPDTPWSLKLGSDNVDKIIFGRLQMVSLF